ncbi:MAG: HNH endonuclease [Myxococcota bacterium]|nr:HNH endonuclease [Myxococcota bacterium]
MSRSEVLGRVQALKVYTRGERRAPHKPLLLLVAIAALERGARVLSFAEVEEALEPLLDGYAPPVLSRHQPELPYWYLRSDGLWTVSDADHLPLQRGGFPRMGALRQTHGGLPAELADALLADGVLRTQVVQALLERHFPDTLHEEILEAVGVSGELPLEVAELVPQAVLRRRRDPGFRRRVLRGYEHRCAVTGFRAALGGRFLGVEAAHVKWHSMGGPDLSNNGVALEPTLHMLFDKGAWTLSDERRVLVSAEFTGTSEAVARLRQFHGKPLREPLPGYGPVDLRFIRWHRDRDKGGVFRGPAL